MKAPDFARAQAPRQICIEGASEEVWVNDFGRLPWLLRLLGTMNARQLCMLGFWLRELVIGFKFL